MKESSDLKKMLVCTPALHKKLGNPYFMDMGKCCFWLVSIFWDSLLVSSLLAETFRDSQIIPESTDEEVVVGQS